MVNTERGTWAWNLPSTQSDDLPSQGHAWNDAISQLLGYRHSYTMDASDRHNTPSALYTWSSISKEKPSNSKFTFGLSPFIFTSCVPPQQVSLPGDSPFSDSRHNSPDSSFRSLDSSCSEENTSFSPTVRYHVDSGTLFGDVEFDSPHTPVRDRNFTPVVDRPPTPSSLPGRQQSVSTEPGLRERADYNLYRFKRKQGAIKRAKEDLAAVPRQTSPESAYFWEFYSPYRKNKYVPELELPPRKPVKRPPHAPLPPPPPRSPASPPPRSPASPPPRSPASPPPRSPASPPPRSPASPPPRSQPSPTPSFPHFEENRTKRKLSIDESVLFTPPSPTVSSSPELEGNRRLKKISIDDSILMSPLLPPSPYSQEEHYENTRRRLKPPHLSMSGSDSSSDDDSPASSDRRACAGIKPPCFQLSSEFTEESPHLGKVVSVTGKEFHHFVNNHQLAAVMFYNSKENMQDTLNVWARQSVKEPLVPDQAFASVDCTTEPDLCAREHIASHPFYKLYAGGYPVIGAEHLKSLNL